MQDTRQYIMKNGKSEETSSVILPQGSGLVYEVIRIINRTPLFLREHYLRFANSAKSVGAPQVPDYASFRSMTDAFLFAQAEENYNIRILFEVKSSDLYILQSPASYPEESLYQTGIHTELMTYTRPDPNSKITNTDLTDRADELRKNSGAYEVLLVNESGFITEGSKSNVFFTDGQMLYTPPLEDVLPGVTRQKILDTANNINIKAIESNIMSDHLHIYEGAFMSGTSPKILPIASIGALRLDSAKLGILRKLMLAFDETIDEDLTLYRQSALDAE